MDECAQGWLGWNLPGALSKIADKRKWRNGLLDVNYLFRFRRPRLLLPPAVDYLMTPLQGGSCSVALGVLCGMSRT